MTSWQSNHIEANGLRLYYTRTGGAKPPVVLAHGITDNGLCWTPVAEALAPTYDVIMVDARGHGRSQAPEQGYGPLDHADDLAGLIAALGLQKPAVLGHSMGAITTLLLAGAYPDVPTAILLEDPPAWWLIPPGESPGDTGWQAEMHERISGFQRKTRQELIAAQRIETPGWSEAELGPWAEAKLQFNPNALNWRAEAALDWPALLRQITCPTLLITADPTQGGLVTPESAAVLQSWLPQLRLASIPKAGHSIRRDQFDPYLAVIRAFLAETMGIG